MPYITSNQKAKLVYYSYDGSDSAVADDAGELTYLLTLPAIAYKNRHGVKFHVLCTIMGAFICAAFEFYRRVIAQYEDQKIVENGDVYK